MNQVGLPKLHRERGASLQEVADAAGVHRSTASRALNPATAGRISAEVVAQVNDIAMRLGYRRDMMAASFRNNRTRLVGVLVPDLGNPVFPPILDGTERALTAAGYAMLIANTRGDDANALILVENLLARRVEGLILATARDRDPVVERCIAEGVPLVLVNRRDRAGRVPSALPDDVLGMRLAVRHLIELGHRNIAHLAGPASVSTGRLRASGFRRAMRDAELPAESIIHARAFTRDEGAIAAQAILDISPMPTAIVAANDLLALGAYAALSQRGLKCPAQMSITGHNDMPLVDMVEPPLTTIRIAHHQIGQEGARLLLARIGGLQNAAPQVLTTPILVVRGSTAALP